MHLHHNQASQCHIVAQSCGFLCGLLHKHEHQSVYLMVQMFQTRLTPTLRLPMRGTTRHRSASNAILACLPRKRWCPLLYWSLPPMGACGRRVLMMRPTSGCATTTFPTALVTYTTMTTQTDRTGAVIHLSCTVPGEAGEGNSTHHNNMSEVPSAY